MNMETSWKAINIKENPLNGPAKVKTASGVSKIDLPSPTRGVNYWIF